MSARTTVTIQIELHKYYGTVAHKISRSTLILFERYGIKNDICCARSETIWTARIRPDARSGAGDDAGPYDPPPVPATTHGRVSRASFHLAASIASSRGGPGRCFCFWRLLMVVVAGAGARRDGTSRAVARRTGEEDASGGVHGRPGYRGAVAGWQASSHLGCRAANPNGPLCVVRCRSLPHLAQQPNVGMLKLPTRREAGG
jgi:hypothetical protein